MPIIGKFINIMSRIEARGEGNKWLLFNGYNVSVWGDKKVLERDMVMITQIMSVLNATELYI
jgi:hypothetical protein